MPRRDERTILQIGAEIEEKKHKAIAAKRWQLPTRSACIEVTAQSLMRTTPESFRGDAGRKVAGVATKDELWHTTLMDIGAEPGGCLLCIKMAGAECPAAL